MTVTTLSGLNNLNKKTYSIFKNRNATFGVVGAQSAWTLAGSPDTGAAPGSAVGIIPDNTTVGAITTNGTAGWLLGADFGVRYGGYGGKIILYDRLWSNSTLDGTVTSTTSLGSTPALTRPNSNGDGTELWIEVYTIYGSTARTLTVVYTNQSGTGSKSATYTTVGAPTIGHMYQMKLADGDTGIRSAQSYSWSGSTGTAGNFGLTIVRRIAEIPFGGDIGSWFAPRKSHTTGIDRYISDWASLGLPQIPDNACLSMIIQGTNTSATFFMGSILVGYE